MRSLLVATAALLVLAASATAAPPSITEFPAGANAMFIDPSPVDGTLWVGRQSFGVQQFSTDGQQLASSLTTPTAGGDLAVDTDGSVFWTVKTGGFGGWARRSPGGDVTQTPTEQAQDAFPITLAGGTPSIAGLFPTSTSSCVYLGKNCKTFGPSDAVVTGLTVDRDGRIWATAPKAREVFRVVTDGSTKEVSDLSVTTPPDTSPYRLALGPDGNLWAAGHGTGVGAANTANMIIRINPKSGAQTFFKLPPGRGPRDITTGPDGALWFAEEDGNSIGRITTSGVYSSVPVPSAASRPFGITTGPDGNIWFTEFDGGRVGRLVPSAEPTKGTPLAATKDTTKPRVGSIGLSRTRFRAAGSGASTSATKKRRKRAPVGTKVRFSLSESSAVKFTVQRKSSGRRSGTKCVKPKRSNRRKKRCTRYVAVKGSFTIRGIAGRNTFTFRGRLARRKLAASSYRMTATAKDPASNASLPKRKGFTIVK